MEKTFLQAPASVLHEYAGGDWKLVAEGDDADNRLTRLLQSRHPGRGATNAAHWGLLGYLWMRQGELAEWPAWTGNPAGQLVQSLLVKVEIDPFIENVRGRMWSVYQENFTATGKQKSGGMLQETEAALERVGNALAKIADERTRLIADEAEYARLSEELPGLEAEHIRHRQDADQTQEAARRAEVAAEEVQRRQHELTTAQDRLRVVQGDRDTLDRQGREIEEIRRRLAAAQSAAGRAAQVATEHQARLAEADRALEAHEAELARLQAAVTRAGKLARHRRLHDGIERLARTLERCQSQTAQVEALVRARAEIPVVTAARLRQLQTHDESIRQRRAQIDALGLRVELIPAADAPGVRVRVDDGTVQELPSLLATETRVVHAIHELSLDLPGWGSLRMRSGAAETRSLSEAVKKDETTLRAALSELGAASLAELGAFVARGKELDGQIEAVRQALAAMLDRDESPESLRTRLAAETRLLRSLEVELTLAADAALPSLAELEAAEQTANVQHEQGRATREALGRQSKKAREAAGEAATAREETARTLVKLRADAEHLERQATALRGRYPDGLEPALDKALFAYAETKFGLQKAQEKLPSDAATLGERNRRAAAAAAQVQGELDRQRRARDEIRGRLEWLGSQALYTRETDLLAEHAALTVQSERARARSRAARLRARPHRTPQTGRHAHRARAVAGTPRRAFRPGQRRAGAAHFSGRIAQHPWPRAQAGRTRRFRRSFPGCQGTIAPLPAFGGGGRTRFRAGRRPAVAHPRRRARQHRRRAAGARARRAFQRRRRRVTNPRLHLSSRPLPGDRGDRRFAPDVIATALRGVENNR